MCFKLYGAMDNGYNTVMTMIDNFMPMSTLTAFTDKEHTSTDKDLTKLKLLCFVGTALLLSFIGTPRHA